MSKFSLGSPKKINTRKIVLYAGLGALLIVLALQVERFIYKGTILGYKARTVSSEASRKRQNQSGIIPGASISKENKKSVACEAFSQDKVAAILGSDIERFPGFIEDRKEPNLVSSCIYKTKGNESKMVSILLRDMKNEDLASKTVEMLKDASNVEPISSLGDQAIYNISANQLTVRLGKRIITVTVSSPQSKDVDGKTTAVTIAELGF